MVNGKQKKQNLTFGRLHINNIDRDADPRRDINPQKKGAEKKGGDASKHKHSKSIID